MVIAMRELSLSTLIVMLIPGIALAQGTETRCTNGDTVRRIVIMSEPGVSVPCEVHYFKDTEAPGEDQVLWRASSQEGFCEEKAAGLVSKLEGLGWDCTAGEAPASPPEPPEPAEAPEEPVDMTDDLAPVIPEDNGD
jgi:hypothetical protein